MRLVQANGIRLAYPESGPAPAPPFLLVHAAQPARFTSAVAVFLAGSKDPADPPG
jgi:hypothetical protein